ncbi:MAG: hypothetical protein H6722_06575 [Sandaracinus sp.]|nr:hypothetical protein [Sandaracinus sp.]
MLPRIVVSATDAPRREAFCRKSQPTCTDIDRIVVGRREGDKSRRESPFDPASIVTKVGEAKNA